MTIRDEARQEAERRWTRDIDVNNPLSGAERRSRRVGFELGALWASEKANREPSDAEVEAAAGAIVEASFGQELPEAPADLARAALLAAQAVRRADNS